VNASAAPVVGVLALQGAFDAHIRTLDALGASPREVRTVDDLAGLDGVVLPGGESTTMSRLLATSGLFEPLADAFAGGLAVFGTCAGLILLAAEVADGRDDQRSFGVLDIGVRRNGYGRQIDSFESDLSVRGLDVPFPAVFIRAPLIERVGPDVDVLASHDEVPVMVRSGRSFGASFHPELTGDGRLHAMFLQEI
jgi:5'-phosphate synthase pdxT subunit